MLKVDSYERIRDIEAQIRELNKEKEDIERTLVSGFLENGGLELLKQVKWYCYSANSDYITASLDSYTSRIFRVKMGLTELYGSIRLESESERNVLLRLSDDDELSLSAYPKKRISILEIVEDYKLGLDLSKNRSSIRFAQMQVDNQKEELVTMEKFEFVDKV